MPQQQPRQYIMDSEIWKQQLPKLIFVLFLQVSISWALHAWAKLLRMIPGMIIADSDLEKQTVLTESPIDPYRYIYIYIIRNHVSKISFTLGNFNSLLLLYFDFYLEAAFVGPRSAPEKPCSGPEASPGGGVSGIDYPFHLIPWYLEFGLEIYPMAETFIQHADVIVSFTLHVMIWRQFFHLILNGLDYCKA